MSNKTAEKVMKKRSFLESFLWHVCVKANDALFAYQVRNGLIQCAVPEDEAESEVENEEAEVKTEGETEAAAEGQETTEETVEDDSVIVTIGDESPPPDEEASAPNWVRELRKNHRELQKKNRELEERLNAGKTETKLPVETIGEKPTLEACDYDAEKFERELEGWHALKQQAADEQRKKQQEADAANAAWQATLDSYGKAKTELRVKDFEDAEEVVKEVLSVTQQGIILQGAANPALVIYALGKNRKKAAELASISDPVKYAFAVANLEKELKVTNRKAPPPPEKAISGTGRTSGTVDSTLERLRAEAAKSGNYSKVIAYKNQQRLKS